MPTKHNLRVITVDDEEPALLLLREFLSTHEDLEIIAECKNGYEAVKAITELKPDLVILDIQMPKLNGFEVLELIDHQPAVIFATAHDQYALKAFEVHAVDYLLKPFSKHRLDEAIEDIKQNFNKKKGKIHVNSLATDARMQSLPLERILVKDGSKVHVIPADKIDYIKAEDDYVSIKTEGKSYLKQVRMATLEKELDNKKFVRIHRSYILNIELIARIELYAKDSRMAILKDGSKLPISRTGYSKLKELL